MSSEPPAAGSAPRRLSPSAADPTVWVDLFSASDQRGREDRELLDRLLASWSAHRSHGECALYARAEGQRTGGEARCVAAFVGTGRAEESFPASFPDAPARGDSPSSSFAGALAAERFVHLDLPSAALVWRGDAPPPAADDPELLLLAAATRVARLKSQVREQSFQAMFRGVEMETLYEVGLAIAGTLDLDQLSEEVLMRAVALLDARRGALFLLDEEADGSSGDATGDGPEDAESESACYATAATFGGEARASFASCDLDFAPLVAGSGDGGVDPLPGARHLLGAPIRIEGQDRGLLVVADKESRTGVGPFSSDDARTLALFANQAAIAFENAKLHRMALEKERLEREMELAAEIQRQLLPKTMPMIEGLDVLGWNRPALHIGGDYFGFSQLDDGQWAIVVGDVVGKGMPAALLVSTLHSALSLMLANGASAEMIARLSRHIYESSSSNRFITGILGLYEPSSRVLRYWNAGHNPGVVVHRDGSITQMPAGGLPLGLMSGATYQEAEVELRTDDLVCLYSDGITECATPEEEEYGLDRLCDLLLTHRTDPLEQVLSRIDDEMIRFAQGQAQGDDQTVVLLRVGG